ncbi:hypothetical protein QFC21_003985 [Naganishia friedmannii]|uniref:Uncharacterized protein n=1 Tax=Naganishia friedmannii TaxID=89922 RepID=A0ACC2VN55_9TREE|nr:hypothetical protein QFC21_003985 [Naganishia friedmannii]
MSPPLSAETNGKGADVKKAMQESPLKNIQTASKRKEMDQGPIVCDSSAPSKRPKTTKPPSSGGRENLISGTLYAQFQEWMLDQPLHEQVTQIPVEYWPLVVMIGHEYSAVLRARLIDHIGSALEPSEITDGGPAIFTQVSYGFHSSDFSSITASSSNSCSSKSTQDIKIPAALALRRWEAKDLDMVPQSNAGRGFKARDVMKERKRFREQAREEVQRIVQTLDTATSRQLLGLDKVDAAKSKMHMKEKKAGSEPKGDEVIEVDARAASTVAKTVKPVKAKPEAKVKPELMPEQLAEKEAKEAERKTKEAEKQKKVEAQNKKAQEVAKSKAMMQSFFKKPTATAPKTIQKPVSVKAVVDCVAVEIEDLSSDFDSHFKRFFTKSTVDIAPVNRFSTRGQKDTNHPSEPLDLAGWQVKDFVKRASEKRPPSYIRPNLTRKRSIVEESRSGLVRKPKTEPPFCTIPDLVDRAQEAEDPRLVYSHLKDLAKFPRKTLKFDEDLRPPYSGTWTAPSWFVGPRTPFALDPNIDYSLDEGLDWEPENLDEGAMDVDEPDESESEDGDDLGSWLASDDEREASPFVALNDPFAVGNSLGMPSIKPTNKEQKLPPRKFEKLIQFSKGPVWEEGLGEVAWKGFEQYRICLLNDAPLGGLDPFTWQPPEASKARQEGPKAQTNHVKQAMQAPAVTSATSLASATLSDNSAVTPVKTLTPRPVPNAKLTQAELADFLQAIDGSDKTIKALVLDLSARFKSAGSQASIKAKVNEVASKTPVKGAVWSIKPAAWVQAGISHSNVSQR